MTDKGELTGQVALITGAGRGIGLAVARELAAGGAGLLLVDREFSAESRGLVEDVRASGRTAEMGEVDLADLAAARQVAQQLVDRAPGVNVLVNNAGWIQVRDFLDISLDEWHQHFAINLSSMFVITQAVLPGMLERGSGRIINISSELGLTGMERYVAYCATKGGVIGFTKALAREVAPHGVRVNSVAPGPVVTVLLTDMTSEYNEETRMSLPARRFGTPEDIALTVAFLAGPGGDFFVGQVLSPNGGAVI